MIHSSDVGSTQFTTTLLQILSLIVSLAGGGLLSAFTKRRWHTERKNLQKIIDSKILFYFFAFLLQAIITPILVIYFEVPSFLLNSSLLVLATLAVNTLILSFTKNPLLLVLSGVLLWGIVLFQMTDLLIPTVQFLDNLSLKIGANELSVLALLKTGFFTFLLIWCASSISEYIERKVETVHHLVASRKILIAKFARIVLIAIAIYTGLSLSGVDLSIFAFFAGALGVGIAFGLQNIFSNFFSGIIILFDRSIKPGDVVSIEDGKIYGVVRKLHARYVSIRTREGKEHLIPNQQIVSNKLENWSFSDSNIRIEIPFSVSFDSNLELVEKILVDIALKTKRVLPTPPPCVRFNSIIDNAVHLKLRLWLCDPQNGLSDIQSSIIFSAWKAFRENGITIPYPPREIYTNGLNDRFKARSSYETTTATDS